MTSALAMLREILTQRGWQASWVLGRQFSVIDERNRVVINYGCDPEQYPRGCRMVDLWSMDDIAARALPELYGKAVR